MRQIPPFVWLTVGTLLTACKGTPNADDPSGTEPSVVFTPATGDTGADGTVPTEGTLSALTYNVHGLPDALTGDDGEARMNAIAPLLERFDVIGLQETFDVDKHALLTAQSTHPVHEWFDELVDDTRFYGSGLAVLARDAELEQVQEQHYAECYGTIDNSSDCLASKGFQRVRLDLGGGAMLDVYNTHHEAGGGEEDEAVRATQVDEVLAAMAEHSAGHAILFMGDTNLRPGDPPDDEQLARYAAAGLRDACLELACPETDHIDRFFVRDGDTVQLTVEAWANEPDFFDDDGVPLSDHPAISTQIRWERTD
jgi:endonuclease/exonuclease/phosphatase family metal-dependent hydrolase